MEREPAYQASFGGLLRQYRREEGLTQEELAERARLSVRGLKYLEGDERHPQASTIRRLADALHLTDAERSRLLNAAATGSGWSILPGGPTSGTGPPPLPASEPGPITVPTNLPDAPTPFIGREREIAQVMAMLQKPHIRLITLTGPGGTGKTRLALQVAEALLPAFRDGVFLVSLASLTDPALVPSAIAETLGVREAAGEPLLTTLGTYLASRRLLLVIDNFEHLLPAALAVASLLDTAHTLHVVVTSRTPLHLSREHEYPVSPFPLPDPAHLPSLTTLARNEAVAFFVERAGAVQPGFGVTEENARAIAEICVRLDGLPLALELAAARTRLLPPPTLLQQLGNRLDLLTGGPIDRPARHQTLRAALDWSFSLLSAEQQILFARLAVFAGGGTLGAVTAICRPDGDPLDDLLALMTQSLVRQEGGVEPRFLMLETIREYAQEILEASGENAAVRDRHLAYFREVAEKAEPYLTGPDQAACLARLEAERENLLAALQWALERERMDEGLRLVTALQLFWEEHGPLGEARRWLEQLLTAGQGTLQGNSRLHARALRALGRLSWMQGDLDAADTLLQRAVSLTAADDEPEAAARILNNLAGVAHDKGDVARAMTLYQRALPLATRVGDRWHMAAIYTNLGNLASDMGDFAQASSRLRQGLDLLEELGERRVMGMNLNVLGEVFRAQGMLDRAEATFRDALRLLYGATDRVNLAYSLQCLARVARDQQALPRAARLLGAADTIWLQCGVTHDPAVQLDHDRILADCEQALGIPTATTARETGAAMDFDDVVAYALEDPGTGRIERR